MSHWVQAREALEHPLVGRFVRDAMAIAFADGYSLKDPHYGPDKPAVEILFHRMDSEKSLLFEAALRVVGIEFTRPCGVTRMVSAEFKASIRAFKSLLVQVSGRTPEEDTNQSVET